jgi:hypothetical protein
MNGQMTQRRRIAGGFLGFVGFMLSPLSWWNDLFVNVPLAVAFAWLVALIRPSAFMAAAVVGYWLTNVLGFVLMHKGAKIALARDTPAVPVWRRFLVDIAVSLLYTLFIVVLVHFKWITPPAGLLHR